MNIKNFEKLIIEEFNKLILQIIKDYPQLNISAKARAGAEISDFLLRNSAAKTAASNSPRAKIANICGAYPIIFLDL